jgi:carboxypeptidase PM20D1
MSEFDKLIGHMQNSFPLVHSRLERTVINGHSLVFKWKADTEAVDETDEDDEDNTPSTSTSSTKQKTMQKKQKQKQKKKKSDAAGNNSEEVPLLLPYLVYGHMDVVPEGDPDAWKHPPFQGVIADGCIWGRGAIDDKQAVFGHLEAVEDLLTHG